MRMYLIGILIFVTAAVFAEEQKQTDQVCQIPKSFEHCLLDHIRV